MLHGSIRTRNFSNWPGPKPRIVLWMKPSMHMSRPAMAIGKCLLFLSPLPSENTHRPANFFFYMFYENTHRSKKREATCSFNEHAKNRMAPKWLYEMGQESKAADIAREPLRSSHTKYHLNTLCTHAQRETTVDKKIIPKTQTEQQEGDAVQNPCVYALPR